jgi:gliding motility-associated-like protein
MTQTATGLCGEVYEVAVTDANGLSDTFQVSINNFVPTVTLSVSAEFCDYDNSVDLVNYSPVPGAGQFGNIVGTGVSDFVFYPDSASAGTHTLVYTFTDENGCTNFAEDEMIVHPTPVVTINVANEYCLNDDPALLTNVTPPTNGTEGTGIISGPGVASGGLNTTFFSPLSAGVGTHTITYTYTTIHGCVNSETDEIIVHPTPQVDINVSNAYCAYDPIVDITLTTTPAINDLSGTGVISGPGVTNESNEYLFDPELAGSGTHTITYTFTTIHGCVNSGTDEIIVHNTPVIDFTADPVEAFVPSTVTFTNNSNFATNFIWYFGDGDSLQSNANSLSHLYGEIGVYNVVLVGEANGCFSSDSLEIIVFSPVIYDIPHVFSPNGDDSNPLFNLINMAGFDKIASFEFLILNRWGNVMRTYTDPYFGWDGKTDNGNDAPEGVYFYKLFMTSDMGDEFENHGYFHLIRQ